MSNDTLHIVARIRARSDAVERVRAVLETLLEPTRAEAGCRRYDLFQNEADPTDFTFIEEWESADALAAHLETEHIRVAREKNAGLTVGETEIGRYRQVG